MSTPTPWEQFEAVVLANPGVHHFDPNLVSIDGFILAVAATYYHPPRPVRPAAEYLPITVDPYELGPHLTDDDRDALRAVNELML